MFVIVHHRCTPLYTALKKACTYLYTFSFICTHKVMPNARTPKEQLRL